jgi:uncharacterized protein YjbJ (UPF0337 family)
LRPCQLAAEVFRFIQIGSEERFPAAIRYSAKPEILARVWRWSSWKAEIPVRASGHVNGGMNTIVFIGSRTWIVSVAKLTIVPFARGVWIYGGVTVDWNRIEGNWKQAQGRVKEKWGKLTDDDLTLISGRREQLEGLIQQRYGLAKDKVRKDVDDWLKSQP